MSGPLPGSTDTATRLARLRQHGPAGPWLSRTSLAFWMIVVSAQGAAVAFWIARTEQQSVAMHRQLTRGQMVELSVRQAIVGDWSFRSALEARQREHRSRADSLLDGATRVQQADRSRAAELEMLAQQELMLWRLTGTLLVPFRAAPTLADVRAKVDSRVTDELSRLGFGKSDLPAHVTAGPAAPAAAPTEQAADTRAPSFESVVGARGLPVWIPLSDNIHALHEHVPRLALGVVLFVLSLVCLTTADLLSGRRQLAELALVVGGLTALGAIVAVLTWDLSAWQPLAVASAFGVILAFVFRATGMSAHAAEGETPHPPELEPRQFLGVHVSLKHVLHNRERVLVGMTALTVLMSSVVGWWFAAAQTRANAATHSAFASEVQLNQLDGERWLEASANLITPTLELFQARMRCAFASQSAALPPDGSEPGTLALLGRNRERDCQALLAANHTSQAAVVDQADFDSGDSPGTQLFAEIRNRGPYPASHLYGMADGYISEAEQWEGRAVTYVLGLTLFAISLYLISQAMGMGGGTPSSVLAVCGSLLALGTFSYAVAAHQRPVMPVPTLSEPCRAEGTAVQVAAMYYGRARAQFETATTGADYQKAAELFGCALEARPDFGRAQYDRSRAASLISQGDTDSSYSNFPTRSRMAEISAAQAEMMRELKRTHWIPTPLQLNSQGFNTVLTALSQGSLPMMDQAIGLLERGITDSGVGTPNGAVDAVKIKAASPADLDVNRMLFTNLGLARLAKGDRANAVLAYRAAVDGLGLTQNRELTGSSLSDLNILEAHCVALHGDGSATCGAVAAGIKEARSLLLLGRTRAADETSGATLTELRAWARASRVGWSGKLGGFDAAKDSLAVVWSAYSDDWQTWRVVQPLFRPVDSKRLAGLTQPEQVSLYNAFPSFCLPQGRYRAEFYLNGERVDPGTGLEMDVSGFENYRSRELDVAMCIPEAWQRTSIREAASGRHLVQAFSNSEKRSALYLFTLFSPRELPDFDGQSMVRAWTLMKQLSGSAPSDEAFRAAIERFKGCDAPIQPNSVLHRVWRSTDGLVHVAFLIGNAAPGGQACEVLESIGAYYDRDFSQVLGRSR